MNDTVSILDEIGLAPAEICELGAGERSRLLNFLLRWERIETLHACLDTLIPRNPTHVSLRDLRARAFLAQGRPDEALPVMEQRIQWRDSLPARALLARIHLAGGHVGRAKEIARGMTQERDESVMAWALLGHVELEAGNLDAAKSAYRRVGELRPHGRAYLRGMLSVYRTEGDLVAASGYAIRLLDAGGEDRPLPVSDLRRLRDYFRLSGETTRVTEMEAELRRRYAEERTELEKNLSVVDQPDAAEGLREGDGKLCVPPEAPCADAARRADSLISFDDVPVSDDERDAITHAVRQFFGFDSLLPGQLETMACVLRGEDVLTVLPTGGGKSLCYQLPALAARLTSDDPKAGGYGPAVDRGTTLVISPLIALMKDQVDSLPCGIRGRATTINSTLDGDELCRRVNGVADGAYRLVYAAPERLRQPPFLHALRRGGVERMVIDEAHCVSMWGHDFRPDYLMIGRVREELGHPPLLAMTATAPQRVRRDILQRLGEPGDRHTGPRIIAGDVTRSNLQLEVLHARDNDQKLRHLLAFCLAEPGSGIVYADTRARCEALAALLRQHGVNAAHYHAGVSDRHRVHDDFMAGRTRVVVATIAFGMGIDKPDIRFIVHYFPPASLESYYQEAGRAGRDGRPSRCLLMVSPHDKGLLTRRARRDVLPVSFLRSVYAAVKARLGGGQAGRIAMADLERDLRANDTRIRVALSLLEEVKLLRRGPDVPRAALVKLSAVCRDAALPDGLRRFRRAAHLRPQQWLTLDLAEVAPKAGIALAEIEQRVLAWEDAGWLVYRPAGRDLLVELLPAAENASEEVEALLERYQAVQMQRVDEVVAYAKTPRCRHGHLNAYLGGRTIKRCSACDNCMEVSPLPDPGLPELRVQLLTVLRCVANAPWSWGRQTLLRILRGEGESRYGKRPLRARAVAQEEFGALAFRSGTAVKNIIETLVYEGFLEPRQLEHGGVVLDLTARGKEALEDPSLLDTLVPSDGESPRSTHSATEVCDGSASDDELFDVLREWRMEQARRQKVSPFVVFHDSHLRAIAATRPTTLAALSDVKGVGPKRLERYGTDLLDLVRGHLESQTKARDQ